MKNQNYTEFLKSKEARVEAVGFDPVFTPSLLFTWQLDIVKWAVRLGRAAIFSDCGTGKSLMQITWAVNIQQQIDSGRILILAPLSVAQQTIQEAKKLDVEITYKTEPDDSTGIWITNYERLHKFPASLFDGIVLDESSILKSLDGKTRTLLLEQFTSVPYRLCCTATPSPNDQTELANHAEFLGMMSRVEMLATFFVHDSEKAGSQGWRLKGHAKKDFWRWVAQWAVYIRKPSDLGYSDGAFVLPPLNIEQVAVESNYIPEGKLFPDLQKGITGRVDARKKTADLRIHRAAEIIKESWKKHINKNTTHGIEKNDLLNQRPISKPIETDESSTCANITNEINNECLNSNRPSGSPIPKRQKLEKKPNTKKTKKQSNRSQENGEPQIQTESEAPILSEITESPLSNMTLFGQDRTGNVPFADSSEISQNETLLPITAIHQKQSEGFSVTPATSASVNSRTTQAAFERQPNTSKTQWLVWCGLNVEQDGLAKLLGNKCVSIQGSTNDEDRILYEKLWRTGQVPVLLCKPGQFGFGMNWQHCNKIMFLGLGDSFEQWYQSVRRCWRFGQKHPVDVVIVTSDAEISVVENVQRKEKQAAELAAGIVEAMKDAQIESVMGKMTRKDNYTMKTKSGENWEMKLGDCVERIKEIETGSVGLSIFSPPFSQLYTYSASERDMGNTKDHAAFFRHFSFLVPELFRVIKPGRRLCVHTQQIAQTLVKDGQIGLYDFRADLRAAIQDHGFIYDGEVVIDKNPQAQAIRTKAKQLMFVQKNKDSAWSRPAMADYILLFRKPGENKEPITHGYDSGVTNEEWIKFAHPIWYDIQESDTLQYASARENEDEKHICPLQLETIRRCVRLWSNPGDLVLSPFAGIGSEGHVSLEQGRRFVGIELKESYWKQAVKNLQNAVKQESLFSAEVVNG